MFVLVAGPTACSSPRPVQVFANISQCDEQAVTKRRKFLLKGKSLSGRFSLYRDNKLEALERLYRSTGLIFLQWQKEVFNNYHSIPAF